ncbi:MAG: asparagine synthase-related protein [Candidatus Micrarchaeota archaeon]|nr:asparagine synthase-related protein [Candidatus Micrarchaeota archaeon]
MIMRKETIEAKGFVATDIMNLKAFPNNAYRYGNIKVVDGKIVLSRDWPGENPLHFYQDVKRKELVVASNICDIKQYREENGAEFSWERVRAVHNNTRITFDSRAFDSLCPMEEEIMPTLQESDIAGIDPSNFQATCPKLRGFFQASIEQRLATIPEKEIGLLLSGGLDSMSVGYVLSGFKDRKITAFTLKVNENDQDIVKSRQFASVFGLELSEVCVKRNGNGLSISVQKYSPGRKLIYEKEIESGIDVDAAVMKTLLVGGSPKKDNALCSLSMYLIGKAVVAEGISTVFCGEGPNEMFNDYCFNPQAYGYSTQDRGDVWFRMALTFGDKMSDLVLGRGGLPKHALARMGKIFAEYGIRLESPYFDQQLIKIMTRIPHIVGPEMIKQLVMGKMFEGEQFVQFIDGTAKVKFQDGSGISRLFGEYDQARLTRIFLDIYGVKKEYL